MPSKQWLQRMTRRDVFLAALLASALCLGGAVLYYELRVKDTELMLRRARRELESKHMFLRRLRRRQEKDMQEVERLRDSLRSAE